MTQKSSWNIGLVVSRFETILLFRHQHGPAAAVLVGVRGKKFEILFQHIRFDDTVVGEKEKHVFLKLWYVSITNTSDQSE